MKQTVFDVLMFLFENYISDEAALDDDQEALRDSLLEAGFKHGEIRQAFDWLEALADMQDEANRQPVQTQHALRIYSDEESEKLGTDCRGFLLFLEQTGVVDSMLREMVIDRVMALGGDEVDLDQLKWVVLMVLFNQPGREAAFAWMEDLVLDEMPAILH